MQTVNPTVKRILLFAELSDGEKYVMEIQGKECEECIAIGWGFVENGGHIWNEFYQAKAAAETEPVRKAALETKANLNSRFVLEPKSRTCDRIWDDGGPFMRHLK